MCFPWSVGIKFSVFLTPFDSQGRFWTPLQKSAPHARWGAKFFLLPTLGGDQIFDFFDPSPAGRPFLGPDFGPISEKARKAQGKSLFSALRIFHFLEPPLRENLEKHKKLKEV